MHGHSHSHDNDHHHSHAHVPDAEGRAPAALLRAIGITALFMAIEVAGGLYSNSLALLSDSGHMLTDLAALCLSLFALWIARKPSTPAMSYGYHRAEIIGAFASVLLIWILAGGLLWEAVQRFQNPPRVNAPVLIGVSILGLIANLISLRFLHGSKDHHINVRAAYLHVLADLGGSLGAIFSGAILALTGWALIDPLITVALACAMLLASWGLLTESVTILMESAPRHLDPVAIRQSLAQIAGVTEVHDLHIWSVGAGRTALSAHLIAKDAEGALAQANAVLESRFNIRHSTLQIEHPDRFQSSRCYDCDE